MTRIFPHVPDDPGIEETDRKEVWPSLGGLVAVGVAFVMVLLILLLVFLSATAKAEDRGSWFKSLKQPVTGASCCDISDCRQTKAEAVTVLNANGTKSDQWWADVEGQWTPIPPEKVLKKTSIDGEAYVCSGYGRKIFCFVPPIMAM